MYRAHETPPPLYMESEGTNPFTTRTVQCARDCRFRRCFNMTLLVAIPILMTLGLPLALAACPQAEEPWENTD